MSPCLLSLIFSVAIQIADMTSFPARIRYTRLGISNSDVYLTLQGKILKLRRPFTVDDDITVEWTLETEALDYLELNAFDIIRAGKNLSLCKPNLQDPDNRQVFELLQKILRMDISSGCPIREQDIQPLKDEIIMNFTYFNDFPEPSCDETDWLLIQLRSPAVEEPILTVLISIHNQAQPILCLEQMWTPSQLKMSKHSTPLVP